MTALTTTFAAPVEAATVRISNYATPPGTITLTYGGTLQSGGLPETLVYGQGTPQPDVPAGDFTLTATHSDASVRPVTCTGSTADVTAVLIVMTTLVIQESASLRCTISTSSSLRSRQRASLQLQFLHVSQNAGAGRLDVYVPGAIYVTPCAPLGSSAQVTYGDPPATLTLPPGRYDFAFVRACASGGTTVDIPVALESIALTAGNAYTMLLVGDANLADLPGSLKLVLLTVSQPFHIRRAQ